MNTVNHHPGRRYARITGLLYLVFAAMGIFGFAYAEPRLYVANNAAATAQRLLAGEALFRWDKALAMVSGVLFIFIVLRLYRLLKPVNEQQARLMVVLVAVTIPAAIVALALQMTALQVFKGHLLTGFEGRQAQDLAMALLKTGNNISQLLTLFWGLWLLPLGRLVYASGFMPRWLGLLLLVNGLGYVVHCFAFILFPAQFRMILSCVFPTYFLGEIPLLIWLIWKGCKRPVALAP